MGIQKNKRPTLNDKGAISGSIVTSTYGSTTPFRGAMLFVSTGAGKQFWLKTPQKVGATIELYCRKATTTNTAFVYLPTGYSFQRTSNSTGATHRKMIFNAGNQGAILRVLTTARVGYVAGSGVTLNTT